jgi:hypothetical protein
MIGDTGSPAWASDGSGAIRHITNSSKAHCQVAALEVMKDIAKFLE